MAVTLDDLKRLLDGEKFRYFVDPNSPRVLTGVQGRHGAYQFTMMLQLDGQFLQMRTQQYQRCEASHPHLEAVLRLLASVNYEIRFIKFGWDPRDGEIVAYGDMWIADGGLTQGQFGNALNNFLAALDESHRRVVPTLETGRDPGRVEEEMKL